MSDLPKCEGCGVPDVGELCDDCIALVKRERDDVLRPTPPDAEAVEREEDILWYAAVTAEQVAQAVRDAIKDEPEDWDADTIAKVDYAHKTARDCRARYREAVERRVLAECEDERDELLAKVKEFNINGGDDKPTSFRAGFGGEAVLMFAKLVVDWWRESGGKNFVTAEVGDPRSSDRFILTMQKKGARSVDEKYLEVCAERDGLLAELAAFRAAQDHTGGSDDGQ